MNILSIDCSTTNGSIALFKDGQVIQSTTWHEQKARHEDLFTFIGQLMPDRSWLSDIHVFAVGRGPGAYSGLRVSLLGAQALAAPGSANVMAVSSMEALALHTSQSTGIKDLTIVGDARRDSVWFGRFLQQNVDAEHMEWRVVKRDEAPSFLSPESVLITPHWDELAFLRDLTQGHQWLDGPQRPTAEHVGLLAIHRLNAGSRPEPATPLYLHPAV